MANFIIYNKTHWMELPSRMQHRKGDCVISMATTTAAQRKTAIESASVVL